MSNQARGARAERKVADELRADGWLVKGTGDAHGAVDTIALRDGEAMLLQIKASSVKRGRFADFPPEDRLEIQREAAKAGFPVWLVWAPPDRKPPRWIHPSEWP